MTEEKPALNLHLVSDSTGETLNHVARACTAQFEGVELRQHIWSLIRTDRQMAMVCDAVSKLKGVVLYTIIQDSLRDILVEHCRKAGITAIPVLDPVLAALQQALGRTAEHQPGRQHALDQSYYKRIEAMEFALACDDGQGGDKLLKAEVLLLGVSRTSKTPTCMYLANRSVFVANIPLVNNFLPPQVFDMKDTLIVGLTREAASLVDIRRNRLRAMNEALDTVYAGREEVEKEVTEAKKLFVKHGWPVIDVTRRSIEETAAEILTMLSARRGGV